MTRPRYQRPKVRREGKHPEQWAARWHVYDAAGKRHSRRGTFGVTAQTTRQEAQTACDERVQRETSQTPPVNVGLTLADLIRDIYMAIHTRWGVNTRMGFTSTIKKHILPDLGEAPIRALTKVSLQKHLIVLASRGLGMQLLMRVRKILRSALEDAVDGDYIPKNPARRLEIPACKPTTETRSLTEEEVGRLFVSVSGKDHLPLFTPSGTRTDDHPELINPDGTRTDAWMVKLGQRDEIIESAINTVEPLRSKAVER